MQAVPKSEQHDTENQIYGLLISTAELMRESGGKIDQKILTKLYELQSNIAVVKLDEPEPLLRCHTDWDNVFSKKNKRSQSGIAEDANKHGACSECTKILCKHEGFTCEKIKHTTTKEA